MNREITNEDELRQAVEQLQVQLAGCLTAAEGHPCDDVVQGTYGWGGSLGAVKKLRKALDAAIVAGGPAAAQAARVVPYGEENAALFAALTSDQVG